MKYHLNKLPINEMFSYALSFCNSRHFSEVAFLPDSKWKNYCNWIGLLILQLTFISVLFNLLVLHLDS